MVSGDGGDVNGKLGIYREDRVRINEGISLHLCGQIKTEDTTRSPPKKTSTHSNAHRDLPFHPPSTPPTP